MTKAKKSPADHSKDYRDREKTKAKKLGIEKVIIRMASGVKAGMAAAMKRNGIQSPQEAWQNLGLFGCGQAQKIKTGCLNLIRQFSASLPNQKPKSRFTTSVSPYLHQHWRYGRSHQ